MPTACIPTTQNFTSPAMRNVKSGNWDRICGGKTGEARVKISGSVSKAPTEIVYSTSPGNRASDRAKAGRKEHPSNAVPLPSGNQVSDFEMCMPALRE